MAEHEVAVGRGGGVGSGGACLAGTWVAGVYTVNDSIHHVDVVEVIRYRHPGDFGQEVVFVMIGIPRAWLAGADAGVAALMATFPPERGHEVMQSD